MVNAVYVVITPFQDGSEFYKDPESGCNVEIEVGRHYKGIKVIGEKKSGINTDKHKIRTYLLN